MGGGFSGGGHPSAAEDLLDTDVETLAPIEVPGTLVTQEQRSLPRLTIDMATLPPLPQEAILVPAWKSQIPFQTTRRPFRDPIADTRGKRQPVTPIKAERPTYPRVAREQGWEGVVILRLEILADGSIGSIEPRQTSGHQLLDESAIQAVRQWRFRPAKEGEIPVPSIVDLPIKFDLHQ